MKKLILSVAALVTLGGAAFAGTQTYSKETATTPPPCPQWYADNEFNLSISGVYGWRNQDDDIFDIDWGNAWGGAIDAKYFFNKYYGFGVQGFILSLDRDEIVGVNRDDSGSFGGVLGTFTLRFPGNCSRFAPYVWVGGGGVWGGEDDFLVNAAGGVVRRVGDDEDAKLMGQFGGGFEVRFTPHFGWQNDVSWNVVDGPHNNFGMARTGLNFAF